MCLCKMNIWEWESSVCVCVWQPGCSRGQVFPYNTVCWYHYLFPPLLSWCANCADSFNQDWGRERKHERGLRLRKEELLSYQGHSQWNTIIKNNRVCSCFFFVAEQVYVQLFLHCRFTKSFNKKKKNHSPPCSTFYLFIHDESWLVAEAYGKPRGLQFEFGPINETCESA